jgi:hypothetical protein
MSGGRIRSGRALLARYFATRIVEVADARWGPVPSGVEIERMWFAGADGGGVESLDCPERDPLELAASPGAVTLRSLATVADLHSPVPLAVRIKRAWRQGRMTPRNEEVSRANDASRPKNT